MKKFVAVFFAVAIILLATACAQAETERVIDLSYSDAYALYVDAVNATRAAGSVSGTLVLFGEFSMLGMSRTNDVAFGVSHIFGDGDNMQGEIDASWTDAGFFSWYRDGMFYFYDIDEAFKFAMSDYVYKRMMLTMLVTDVLFPEEGIFGHEVIKDSYGTAMLFEVSESSMRDVLRELANFEDTGGIIVFSEDEVSYEFLDAVVRMRIGNEGELEQIRVAFRYVVTHHHIDESAVSGGYLEVGMILAEIGDVKIDFPDELSDFPLIDALWG
ncbi:MAG: hypothetical protein FWC75_01860 [Oscillospiraceae bacterium]|nr:hypothetical protein [Oscillospiraceae bacterium]